jgi:flagellar hook-basal body complex protein FliE
MNINPIQPSTLQAINPIKQETKIDSPAKNVTETFDQALQSLTKMQENSDGLIQQLASGEDVDVHQVLIAAETTDINFRIAVAIRDKLVEAYREVMRMGV